MNDTQRKAKSLSPKTSLKERLFRLSPLVAMAAILVAFFGFGGHQWLSLDTLNEHRANLLHSIDENPLLIVGGFVLLYIVVVAASLPGATVLTLSAGVLFGQMLGTLFVVIAATIGACVLFWVVNTALGQSLRDRAGPWFHKIAAGFQDGAISYLLFLRLVPVFPFFAVNIVGAMMGVKPWTFAWTTALGILPGSAVFVAGGVGLNSAVAQGSIFTPEIATAFAGLGGIALIPVLYRFYKTRKDKG